MIGTPNGVIYAKHQRTGVFSNINPTKRHWVTCKWFRWCCNITFAWSCYHLLTLISFWSRNMVWEAIILL